VAIDNGSGAVRAMVSGTQEYAERPFNLATQGQRQPGSAMKPFILAQALREGYGPGSVWPSKRSQFCIDRTKSGCREAFVVNNFENAYAGRRTLAEGLTYSDNSVYATAGIKLGTKKVARLAEEMGIRTPVSSNLAMTLGGLEQGLTPLDLAHAYETFQTGGQRVTGTLGAPEAGPVGSTRSAARTARWSAAARTRSAGAGCCPSRSPRRRPRSCPPWWPAGRASARPCRDLHRGQDGTTENSGDAWFVASRSA
jgi:penicillin-binding protein 1A